MVGETKKEAIKTKKEAGETKTSSCRGHPVPTGSRDGRIVVPGKPGTYGGGDGRRPLRLRNGRV